MLSTGALIFSALTLLFALFSMFLGNRISSLQSERIKAQKENVAEETTAVEEMKNTLNQVQQDLKKEKAGSKKLRKQLDAAMQELKTTRSQLSKARKTIDDLRAKNASAPPSLPSASQPGTDQQATPAVTSPAVSGKTLPSNIPASKPTPKAAGSTATVEVEQAAQPSEKSTALKLKTSAPAPEKPDAAIEESNIEVDPVDAGEQSLPKAQRPAMKASEPAATN
jgi:seryl-tRNA synthetase